MSFKRIQVVFPLFFLSIAASSQSISDKLDQEIQVLIKDKQLSHAHLGFDVVDVETGATIYDHNAALGLSPASSQKIFTSIASFSELGMDFRFKTVVGFQGNIKNGILKGDLIIRGIGDPTLGSWRYAETKPEKIKAQLVAILQKNGIHRVTGQIIADPNLYSMQVTPGGWPWNDIGQYYGAACWGLNWKENQETYSIKGGNKIGGNTTLVRTENLDSDFRVYNIASTTERNAGDGSYTYIAPYSNFAIVDGVLPAGKITSPAVAMSNPPKSFAIELKQYLLDKNIEVEGAAVSSCDLANATIRKIADFSSLDTLYSPNISVMMREFLQKSINLYGESFIKTLAYQHDLQVNTENGVITLKDFWRKNGIDNSELHIIDGSGLSPQNYVTPAAEVKALLYAKKQDWFDAFYNSLPIYNDMHMKSGTISVCKAFAGYQTSKNGKTYAFSIIVNNYDGSHASLVSKLYKILNVLK